MSGMFPIGGSGWMREVERRLRILDRHNHPDPTEVSIDALVHGRAQSLVIVDALRSVSSSGVAWTSRVMVMGFGVNDVAPSGYYQIPMPANGTVIPVHCNGATTSVTVTSGFIPLPSWNALYWDMPTQDVPSTGLHIVGYTGDPVQIPRRWVKIVQRNGTSEIGMPYQWGNGERQDYDRAVSFQNSWANYGNGYADVTYTRVGDLTVLSGMAAGGTVASGSTGNIFTLPAGFRPKAPRQLYATLSNSTLGRLDVFDTGEVRAVAGSNAWISMEAVRFPYQ